MWCRATPDHVTITSLFRILKLIKNIKLKASTRHDHAWWKLVQGSSRAVNIFHIFTSFNWWRIWKPSSAFDGSLNKRDMVRKQPGILFSSSDASSCFSAKLVCNAFWKHVTNTSYRIIHLQTWCVCLRERYFCISCCNLQSKRKWPENPCKAYQILAMDNEQHKHKKSKRKTLRNYTQTFASAQESAQEPSLLLYHTLIRLLPNALVYHLWRTQVGTRNHII